LEFIWNLGFDDWNLVYCVMISLKGFQDGSGSE
jgi:hypothetical protein